MEGKINVSEVEGKFETLDNIVEVNKNCSRNHFGDIFSLRFNNGIRYFNFEGDVVFANSDSIYVRDDDLLNLLQW